MYNDRLIIISIATVSFILQTFYIIGDILGTLRFIEIIAYVSQLLLISTYVTYIYKIHDTDYKTSIKFSIGLYTYFSIGLVVFLIITLFTLYSGLSALSVGLLIISSIFMFGGLDLVFEGNQEISSKEKSKLFIIPRIVFLTSIALYFLHMSFEMNVFSRHISVFLLPIISFSIIYQGFLKLDFDEID